MGSRIGGESYTLGGNLDSSSSSSSARHISNQLCQYKEDVYILHIRRSRRAPCHSASKPMINITTPKVMLVMTSGETELCVVCPEVGAEGVDRDDIVSFKIGGLTVLRRDVHWRE